MSPLHARIKFMECVLHVSYGQDHKIYGTRGLIKRALHLKKKAELQRKFEERLWIKVDSVLQWMGTTDDGNTSRRFSADVQLSADIKGAVGERSSSGGSRQF